MTHTRRGFLQGMSALVVSFSMPGSVTGRLEAQGQSATQASHPDPKLLDSWIAVNADGRVTAFTGKCDLGQGIYTAQTQLIAEELCVALTAVKLVQCDTAVTPDQGHTAGSQSTPTNFNDKDLALAAATAREALLRLAAARFGEDTASLRAENGSVFSNNGRSLRYAELVQGGNFHLRVDTQAKRRTQDEWTVLGKPVPSLDRVALMTGNFDFVQSVKIPGMLHGRVVRPPQIGAALVSVDEHSVSGIAGLVKVVIRKDFVGVVAETQFAATKAARQLSAHWKLPAALPDQQTFFEHMQRQPARDDLSVDSGDVTKTLKSAHRVVTARYTYPFQMHGSLGSSCAVADVKADGATVWSATQSVYPTRACIAILLGMPLESVRVIFTRGSGCYGLNGADAVSFDAAVLSQAAGRPVRLQYTRQDEMAWENYGAAMVVEHRAGLDATGTIVAWDRENWAASLGNRPGYDRPGNVISGLLLGYDPETVKPAAAEAPRGPLRNGSNIVPSYFSGCIAGDCKGGGTIRSERALTHIVASPFFTGPLRSPMRIQNTFATECFMDELASAAGADPLAYRLQHLRHERVRGVLQAVAEKVNWKPQRLPNSRTGKGEVSGRGLACVAYEGENGYAALVADVVVNTESGVVRPVQFTVAIDCGPISNPDGLRNQVEGGILQGMSRALVEKVTWNDRAVTSVDWETYNSLHLSYPMPPIDMVFVEPRGVPATGAGETSITVTPAAIGNAIFAATGARLRDVPFTPERMLAALHKSSPQRRTA